MGSKLVRKQRQGLVLSQDQISLHCNNTDIHLTFKGSRSGRFRVPSCLFLHRNAVRPYLQRPGIDWRTPHNYSAPFTTAQVRRWAFQIADLTKDGATRMLRPTCSKTRGLTIKAAPSPYAPARILFFLPEKNNMRFHGSSQFFQMISGKADYTSHNVLPSTLPDQPLAVSISC